MGSEQQLSTHAPPPHPALISEEMRAVSKGPVSPQATPSRGAGATLLRAEPLTQGPSSVGYGG